MVAVKMPSLSALVLMAAGVTEALHSAPIGGSSSHQHMKMARNHRSSSSSSHLEKRGYSGRATNYEAGLGACGGYNNDGDYIVAINQAQWNGGSNCGKSITIMANGKSAQATVVDLCPGCPYGALDLTPSLFQNFAPLSDGVFQMNWNFGGGGGGGSGSGSGSGNGGSQSSSTSQAPKPTSTTATSSTSSTTSTTKKTTTTTTASSTSTSAAAATSTSPAATTQQSNIDGLGKIFDGFVSMANKGQDQS